MGAISEFNAQGFADIHQEVSTLIDRALAAAEQGLAGLPDQGLLASAAKSVASAGGALQMVGLQGPARFASEIARLLGVLQDQERTVASATLGAGACKRACGELAAFLDELARGRNPVLLRLFQAFREVRLASGADGVCESELFYPALDVQLSARAPAPQAESVSQPSTRTQFQKGLLRWLQDRNREGLHSMREAVLAIEQRQGQSPSRAFWTATVAFLDAVMEGGLSREARVTQLLPRLDVQMKRSAEGTQATDDALLREMLYFIAVSQPLTERIKLVQAGYELDSYLPSLGEAQQRELSEGFIPQIRASIGDTKTAWMGSQGGNPAALAEFKAASHGLAQLARRAGHMPMVSLLESFAELADRLARGEVAQSQSLALYVATLLVWVEQAVENGTWCDAGFTSAMQIFARDMRDVRSGMEPVVDLKSVAERDAQGRAVLASVAAPVNEALQSLRQGIEAFIANPSQRERLQALAPTFSRLAGAFTLLEFETAARLVRTAQGLCERLLTATDQEHVGSLVEAITGTRMFFETVQQDPIRAEQLGRDALRRLGVPVDAEPELGDLVAPLGAPSDEAQAAFTDAASSTFTNLVAPESVAAEPQSAAMPAQQEPEAATADVAAEAQRGEVAPAQQAQPAELDPDLLEVFLEEATEVLGTIGDHLARLTANGADLESFAVVRRGFHTLKGSGRMVGLNELAELAWTVEEIANKKLEQKEAPTAQFIALAAAALSHIQTWVNALKAGTPVSFEAADISALAARLRAEGPGAPLETRKEIRIGDVALGHTLYNILLSEAESRVHDLERRAGGLGMHPAPTLKDDLMRAAHTLAGIAQNTGFPPIADLAHALERWAQSSMDRAGALRSDEPKVVSAAVAALGQMVQQLREQRAPQAVPAQVAALEALIGGVTRVESGPRERRQVRDDIDSDLMPVFLEEAEELYAETTNAVRQWRLDPANEEVQRALSRSLHTLKGSSRMAGGLRLGELVHKVESIVEADKDRGGAFFDQLEDMVDRIGSALEELQGGLGSEEARVEAPRGELTASTTVTGTPADPGSTTTHARMADVDAPAARTEPEAQKQQFLKVGVDAVTGLGDEAAEINIVRSRLEGQLAGSRASLTDLADNVERLRKQLREMEIQAETQIQSRLVQVDSAEGFDPLEFDRFTRIQELTRFMTETVHDVAAIQQQLEMRLDETESFLRHQGRLNLDLQDGLAKLRMVPLGTVSERLHRTVRQAARTLARKARLEIAGGDIELDRALLERLTAPFEHLLRNAVAHGVQDPETRARAGKPEAGEIVLTASQGANQLRVVVRDDGAGLDLEQVRAKAIQQGLLDPHAQVSDADVMHLIFAPGFSTAQAVSEVAGRGVGLDVVKTEITDLGGSVEVNSVAGQGVSFDIRVPLTRSVTKAVLVHGGARLYALPSAGVEQVLCLEAGQMESMRREGVCEWSGNRYPYAHLMDLFAEERPADGGNAGLVVLARSGHERAAIEVDGLLGNREIAIKQLGPQFAGAPWIVGGTVLGDGQAALIVDPMRMERMAGRVTIRPAAEAKQQARTILVVDDSLTVRKITDRVLSRHGYRVITAKDGTDALEQIQNTVPDLALVDIEMPRMDGFELTKRLRASSRTAALPIIMITSRTAEKHRSHAQQIGVNAYLGKPYEEEQLLAEMNALLGALPKAA
jgi:chemosensory pili system protein ChpA (sensor histidine kinase/response regulator)